jgi:hypothetical protein
MKDLEKRVLRLEKIIETLIKVCKEKDVIIDLPKEEEEK